MSDRTATIENVEDCNFNGKWVRDMDRTELLEVIVWAINERQLWLEEAKINLAGPGKPAWWHRL